MSDQFEKPAVGEPPKEDERVIDERTGVVMNKEEHDEMRANEDKNNP